MNTYYSGIVKELLTHPGLSMMQPDEIDFDEIKNPVMRLRATVEAVVGILESIGPAANPTGIPIEMRHDRIETQRFDDSVILTTDLQRGSTLPVQLPTKWGHEADIFRFLSKYYYAKFIHLPQQHGCNPIGFGGDGIFVLARPEKNLQAIDKGALLSMDITEVSDAIAESWSETSIQTPEGNLHRTRIGMSGGEGTFVEIGDVMAPNSEDLPLGRLFNRLLIAKLMSRAPRLINPFESQIPFMGIHVVGEPMNKAARMQAFGKQIARGTSEPHSERTNAWIIEDLWKQLAKPLKDLYIPVAENVSINDVSSSANVYGLPRGKRYDVVALKKAAMKYNRQARRHKAA